jgi:LPXTG-motif cell wall-anchored protein
MNKRTIGSALGAAGLIAASALAVLTSATPASATEQRKCEVIKHESLDGYVTQYGDGSAELTHWGLGLETKDKRDSVQWGYDLKPAKKLGYVKELSYKTWVKDHGQIPTLRLGVRGHKKWEDLLLVFQPGNHLEKSGDVEKGGHGTTWRATDDDAQWLILKVHDKPWGGDDHHEAQADDKAAVADDSLDSQALDERNKPYVVSWEKLRKWLGGWDVTSVAVGLGPWAKHGDATVNELTVKIGYDCKKHYWKKPKDKPSPEPTDTETTKPAPNDTDPAAPAAPGGGGGDGPALPVTGAGVAGISIAGLALLTGGAVFMVFTRRRRFEA